MAGDQWPVASVECGVWSVECGVWSVESILPHPVVALLPSGKDTISFSFRRDTALLSSRRDAMSITPGFNRGYVARAYDLPAPTGRNCPLVVAPRWGLYHLLARRPPPAHAGGYPHSVLSGRFPSHSWFFVIAFLELFEDFIHCLIDFIELHPRDTKADQQENMIKLHCLFLLHRFAPLFFRFALYNGFAGLHFFKNRVL